MSEPGTGSMGWLAFFASIIGSLAWPAVLLAVVTMFRKPLTALLKNMSSFEGFGAAAKFERGLEESKELAAVLSATSSEEPSTEANVVSAEGRAEGRSTATGEAGIVVPPPLPKNLSGPLYTPNIRIAYDWQRILDALDRKALSHGFRPENRRSVVTQIWLMAEGHIDSDLIALIGKLDRLRNLAVHSGQRLSEDDAEEYARQTEFVLTKLEV